MSVMIIDPSLKDAQALAEAVRGTGRVPLTTDSPKSALAILRKESLELVLLSINGHRQRAVEFLEASQDLDTRAPRHCHDGKGGCGRRHPPDEAGRL